MSNKTVFGLLCDLIPDPWRERAGFSSDMEATNRAILTADQDQGAIQSLLSGWIQKYQPCLFGRMAARTDTISYCILTEHDLQCGDESVRDKIQASRSMWTRDGFNGRKSGFIVYLASPRVVASMPNDTLKALAELLCSYYLLREVKADLIYHDEIWLEKPGSERATWKWLAGVNYFCANGDRRWWQDHRIPGGLAFSVNSVGHLAKSGLIADAMQSLDRDLGLRDGGQTMAKVSSLGKALEFAMRTISMASDAISGKATELIPAGSSNHPNEPCQIELPSFLKGKDHRFYKGYYHTDVTIPTSYFLSDIERPVNCEPLELEFTYLFGPGIENPDFITMGSGRRVRVDDYKLARMVPVEEKVDANPRLVRALEAELNTAADGGA